MWFTAQYHAAWGPQVGRDPCVRNRCYIEGYIVLKIEGICSMNCFSVGT